MRVLVTGCAGFVGSSVCERLLASGVDVIGVDVFTDYYERWIKERNLAVNRAHPRFRFIETDINRLDVKSLLGPGDAVVHEAAQAGVRASWGSSFEVYTTNNILGTQRLLEGCRDVGLSRFVYAGSSSAYGDAPRYPTRETDIPKPVSPYGVSKLAGEHLCDLYRANFGVPTAILRYFTVYGPRQRPDMAFHRWCRAALTGETLTVFGDGEQTRDFTFIDDAVSATVRAIDAPGAVGEIVNVGGGHRITVRGVLEILARTHGSAPAIRLEERQKGDVLHTGADIAKARSILGFDPRVRVEDGLPREYADIKKLYGLG